MSVEKKVGVTVSKCLVPLPIPKRGYRFVMDSLKTDDGDWLAFCRNRYVVIQSLSDETSATLFSEHKEPVSAVAFSPCGEFVASAASGTCLVWGRKNLKVQHEIPAPADCLDICWSPDSENICCVGKAESGNNLSTINLSTQEPVGEQRVFVNSLLSCCWAVKEDGGNGNLFVSGEISEVTMLHGDEYVGSENTLLIGHNGYVNCVRASPDGKFVASSGTDKQIVIYKVEGGSFEIVKTIKKAHKGGIYCISWSPDSKFLLSSSGDKTAKIWDVEAGKATKTFTFENNLENMQLGCIWHEGEESKQYLVTCSFGGKFSYLDPEEGEIIRTVEGIPGEPHVQLCCKDPMSSTLYFAMKGIISSCSFESGWRKVDGGHGSSYNSIACSCDGKYLYCASGKSVYVLNTESFEFEGQVGGFPGRCFHVAASNKDPNMYAVALDEDKMIAIVKDGSIIIKKEMKKIRPVAVTFSADDTTILFAAKDNYLYKMLFKDNAKLIKRQQMDEYAKSPNVMQSFGDYFYLCGKGGRILIFESAKDGGLRQKNPSLWAKHKCEVTAVSWNPNGSMILSCSVKGEVLIWTDTKKFGTKNIKQLAHPGGAVYAVWFDETNFVTVGNSGVIKMWTIE